MGRTDREQARQELQEANDVLSHARPVPARDQAVYQEGLRLARLKQQDANKRLGK